tara:strand:- start:240 stop:386 length:147 start_codon:yes stop_codon:yes gene_type:complete
MKNIYVLLKVEVEDQADITDVVSDVERQAEAAIIDYMWLDEESPFIAY